MTIPEIVVLTQKGYITTDGVHASEATWTSKALRAIKRANKAAQLGDVKVKVYDALKVLGTNEDTLLRLDDVLKKTELDKSEYRDLILQSLRDFRSDGLVDTMKLSNNNFQIYWKVTSLFLEMTAEAEVVATEPEEVAAAPEVEVTEDGASEE